MMENQSTPSRILRIAEVEYRTGFKRSYIYRLIRNKQFPDRIRTGIRAVGWECEKIDQWIQEKLQSPVGKEQP